jgi:hypothetical protein
MTMKVAAEKTDHPACVRIQTSRRPPDIGKRDPYFEVELVGIK